MTVKNPISPKLHAVQIPTSVPYAALIVAMVE